jgi:hypothetical protein
LTPPQAELLSMVFTEFEYCHSIAAIIPSLQGNIPLTEAAGVLATPLDGTIREGGSFVKIVLNPR